MTMHARLRRHPPIWREHRELRFAPEVMGSRSPEQQTEAPRPREAIRGPREAPRNREEARRAVDELIRETQRELDRRVRGPLERTLAHIREIQASVRDLPAEDVQRLETMAQGIEAELERQNVGGELAYFGVTIEYPRGSMRPMKMADGSVRDVRQEHSYGRLTGIGRDGEAADAYIGPDIHSAENVFAIDQGDEMKYMIGFRTPELALAAYCANHPERTAADVPPPTAIPVTRFRERFGLPGTEA
jgi:hypothetical protein